jgi:FdhD protein
MSSATRPIDVVRVLGPSRSSDVDRAAVEEPLEIRLHGRRFVVIMRTPGSDRELAAGFLLAEQTIRGHDDLGAIEFCTDPQGDVSANVLNVILTAPALVDQALAERRHTTANSSCGLCGRTSIESLAVDVPPVTSQITASVTTLATLPDLLRGAQTVFDETGGLHAAGLFTHDGEFVGSAEDVGRHNAVDKVIGRRLLVDELPLDQSILFVSGRTSFEIVQKALLARIPIVASVSAPSSLAIQLASDMGITLAGFVRGEGFNIYTHAERIRT